MAKDSIPVLPAGRMLYINSESTSLIIDDGGMFGGSVDPTSPSTVLEPKAIDGLPRPCWSLKQSWHEYLLDCSPSPCCAESLLLYYLKVTATIRAVIGNATGGTRIVIATTRWSDHVLAPNSHSELSIFITPELLTQAPRMSQS